MFLYDGHFELQNDFRASFKAFILSYRLEEQDLETKFELLKKELRDMMAMEGETSVLNRTRSHANHAFLAFIKSLLDQTHHSNVSVRHRGRAACR